MTPEAVITAPSDVSSTPAATSDSQSAASSTASPAAESTSSGNVTTTPPVQAQTAPEDPLAGVPSIEDAQKLDSVSKEAFLSLRGAYDKFKPQFDEVTEKFKTFEPFADRFTAPEELQELVDIKERLFGYERDDRNQLIPSTEKFVEYLGQKYPQHADFLTADLLDQPTLDPETGRTVPRIDLALEAMRDDPARRAKALQILGGVEPTAIAPTWQPTTEELNAILKDPDRPTPEEQALQDVYRKLPYDERESLKLNDPDFIRNYLKKEKFQQDLIEQNRQAQEREQREIQQRQVYQQQQAANAGNEAVEQAFRNGFTEYRKSIVERAQFIAPLDPQSPEAQQMAPEQVQQYNATAQQVNEGMGTLIALATAAMSVPDTQWLAVDFFKALGVDDKTIQAFDASRQEFASNTRNYGELSYLAKAQGQTNGNGSNSIGNVQSNATRAMKSMKGYGNALAGPLFDLVSKVFALKAGSYNSTLNGRPAVRPPVNGNGYDPTTASEMRQPRDPSDAWNPERTIDRFLPR